MGPSANKDSFSYRKLGTGDVDLMRRLNEVFAVAFEDPHKHLSMKPTDKYLKELLAKRHFIVLVAMHNKNVVGGLVAYVLDKYEQECSEIYIYDLAVDESFRRQGIARQLIYELKSYASDYSASVIYVQAYKEDEPAINLYRSLGTEEEPFHFDIPVAI